MQKLFPLKVPWSVSPSTPYLRLLAFESPSSDTTSVSFIAYFGLENSVSLSSKRENYAVVNSPYDSGTLLGPQEGPYQLLKLSFTQAIAARMLPAFSDTHVINPSHFDFSALPQELKSGQKVEEWLSSYRNVWRRDGLCPNPGFYYIRESLWMDEIRSGVEFMHYLVAGHDSYVEIIAKNWEWMSEGKI